MPLAADAGKALVCSPRSFIIIVLGPKNADSAGLTRLTPDIWLATFARSAAHTK